MTGLYLPRSLEELWRVLEREPEAALYAGGTDLLVRMRAGMCSPPALVCLERIGELRGLREEGDGLRIGAAETHANLLRSPLLRERLPVLASALDTLGSPLIRNMGTLGGNVCTASPAGDTLPPLIAAGAVLELGTPGGRRDVPLRDFITGPGETDLRPGEVLLSVRVPGTGAFNVQHFEKVGLRNALACCVVSLAALLAVSGEGVVEKAVLAWGSVGPTVVTCPEAEEVLVGGRLSGERLRRAAALVRERVSPIDDLRASAAYRREVAGNLLFRLLDVPPRQPGFPAVSR